MEYDFTYQRDTRQFGLVLAPEYQILATFLVEEFAANATAIAQLLQQLTVLTSRDEWRYQGKEFVLAVEHAEVLLQHNSVLQDHASAAEQQLLLEEQLQLDEQGLSCQCGLEDFVKLLQDWHRFITE